MFKRFWWFLLLVVVCLAGYCLLLLVFAGFCHMFFCLFCWIGILLFLCWCLLVLFGIGVVLAGLACYFWWSLLILAVCCDVVVIFDFASLFLFADFYQVFAGVAVLRLVFVC